MTDVMINKEVEVFFTGKPETRALFRAVERKIRAIGPAIITVTKTQISFATRTQFAWIWMPQPTDRKSTAAQFGAELRLRAPNCA
ncbi:MAG: hypothetical protein GX662_12020 [Trichococcus flocculiformis]|uniref:DUF5655 domain-containing protein n=1 Tax=Trichococcus flocculiformis TaxID=82803 RepID=A0A847D7U2_9LACT|nr:DUF5655 domain-containing protein [Trichococcus flocculiformis]NLD32963.1 hypothetical protein [Trichococcus flocculiformis]